MYLMRKALIIVLCLVAVTACVSDQAYRTYVSEGTYPARNVSQVEILYQKPSREFVVVADLQARGNAEDQFRKAAARLGADAVIISRLGGYVGDTTWADGDDGNSYSRIIGTAIKYK